MKKEFATFLAGTFAFTACVLSVSAAQSGSTAPLPAPATSQTPQTSMPSDPPEHPTTPAQDKPDPRMYLSTARQLITQVPDNTLDGDGRKKLATLRTNFQALMTEYERRLSTNAPAENWKQRFDDVERNFVSILGAGASTDVRSTTAVGTAVDISVPGTTVTTGGLAVAVSEVGVKNLDANIRTQLDLARRNVEQFFDGATRTSQTQ